VESNKKQNNIPIINQINNDSSDDDDDATSEYSRIKEYY
jgi:hypothetical protein